MSEEVEEVVTGEEVTEVEELTPPPGESDEVKGLKAAASANRHKWQDADQKRKIAEDEAARLRVELEGKGFNPADREAVAQTAEEAARRVLTERDEQSQMAEFAQHKSKMIAEGAEKHPDLNVDALAADPDFMFSEGMDSVLWGMPDGMDVLAHLNANREESARIAQLSPLLAAQEMGRISEQLKSAGGVKVSNASKPITPVGSRSVSTKNPDDMSPAEYEAYSREQRGGSVFVS